MSQQRTIGPDRFDDDGAELVKNTTASAIEPWGAVEISGTDATTGTIKIPGINAYNVSQSFGIGNSPTPIGPSTSKINPPITDAGMNVLCKKPTFARIYVPSNKNILNTPKAYNISANTLEDIKTPPQT